MYVFCENEKMSAISLLWLIHIKAIFITYVISRLLLIYRKYYILASGKQ